LRYHFYTADVFTNRRFGGNPLAVFPEAQGLTDGQMQAIAREFNLSETVFVFPPIAQTHSRKLRIFTPGRELAFAGHPTVGTAYVLAEIGELADQESVIFEEGVGPVPVKIQRPPGMPIFTQLAAAKLPEFSLSAPKTEVLAAILGLELTDFMTGIDFPQVISCGIPFLFIPLKTQQAVERARMNLTLWENEVGDAWMPPYIFSYQTISTEAHIYARMFFPELGTIIEDPATGSAAAALAGYLGSRSTVETGTLNWLVEQGFTMGRPSLLYVEADKAQSAITAVRVGGNSVLVSEGWFLVE